MFLIVYLRPQYNLIIKQVSHLINYNMKKIFLDSLEYLKKIKTKEIYTLVERDKHFK